MKSLIKEGVFNTINFIFDEISEDVITVVRMWLFLTKN